MDIYLFGLKKIRYKIDFYFNKFLMRIMDHTRLFILLLIIYFILTSIVSYFLVFIWQLNVFLFITILVNFLLTQLVVILEFNIIKKGHFFIQESHELNTQILDNLVEQQNNINFREDSYNTTKFLSRILQYTNFLIPLVIIYMILTIILSWFLVFIWQRNFFFFIFIIANLILYLSIIIFEFNTNKRIQSFIKRRRETIWQIIDILGEGQYKINHREDTFNISSNGNSYFTRKIRIGFSTEAKQNIGWAKIRFSSTNNFGKDFYLMKLKASTLNKPEKKLSYIDRQPTSTVLEYAIILENSLSIDNPEEAIHLRLFWPEVWKELITNLNDEGVMSFDFDTDECVLRIILPKGYSLEKFDFPGVHGILDKTTENNAQLIKYTMSNLRAGQSFRYFISIKKSP